MQRIPDWWSWYYYLNPFSWSIYGLVASQLGHDFTNTVNTYGCALGAPAHQTACCKSGAELRRIGV